MGTKNTPGPFDCYAKAEPDEPLFVLLARDKHAPTLIWLWATLRELDGEDPAKVHEALQSVTEMLDWAYERKRPVVGIGQAALAAVMELIRAVNAASDRMGEEHKNQQTVKEAFRLFLAKTSFEI